MPYTGGITGSSPVPHREEGTMPSTTAKIDRDQRDGLYELVRNHLGAVGDIWIALEETEDFATAERLGIEFGEGFRLHEDIGWSGEDDRDSFDLTMPAHDLMEQARFSGGRGAGHREGCGSPRGSPHPASAPEKPRHSLRSRYGGAAQRDIHSRAS